MEGETETSPFYSRRVRLKVIVVIPEDIVNNVFKCNLKNESFC